MSELRAFFNHIKDRRMAIQPMLDDENNLMTLAKSIRSNGAQGLLDQIMSGVGFTDSHMTSLIGAEVLRHSYLDKSVEVKLLNCIDGMVTDAERAVSRAGTEQKRKSVIRVWYADFQTAATEDWRLVLEILFQQQLLSSRAIREKLADCESKIVQRATLASRIESSTQSLEQLNQEFYDLDESIGKTLLELVT